MKITKRISVFLIAVICMFSSLTVFSASKQTCIEEDQIEQIKTDLMQFLILLGEDCTLENIDYLGVVNTEGSTSCECAEFSYSDYYLRYDLNNNMISRISRDSNKYPKGDLSVSEIESCCENAFISAERGMIEEMDDIQKEVLDYGEYVGVIYTGVLNSIKVPMAGIFFDNEGKLYDATFLHVLHKDNLKCFCESISMNEAKHISDMEIEMLLERKGIIISEKQEIKNSLITVEKEVHYQAQRVCWKFVYEYYLEEGFLIHFEIYVDALTGSVVESSSNLF